MDCDGDYDGDQGDGGNASISREDAIKIQQNKVESLKLDIRESKLNIEKLEKKVKKEVIYSKLDGTVAKVGDPATTASDGSDFTTIKSKEGFYVKGTVSELMLDQIKEGTILNCSGQSGDFEAEVVDVSEYPVSGEANRAQLSCHNCAYAPDNKASDRKNKRKKSAGEASTTVVNAQNKSAGRPSGETCQCTNEGVRLRN